MSSLICFWKKEGSMDFCSYSHKLMLNIAIGTARLQIIINAVKLHQTKQTKEY